MAMAWEPRYLVMGALTSTQVEICQSAVVIKLTHDAPISVKPHLPPWRDTV